MSQSISYTPPEVGHYLNSRSGATQAQSAATSAMVKTIAMPHSKPFYRYSSPYSCAPTAQAQPWRVSNEDWTGTMPATPEGRYLSPVPFGEHVSIITRSPFHAQIQSLQNLDALPMEYRARFVNTSNNITGGTPRSVPHPIDEFYFPAVRDPWEEAFINFPITWFDDEFIGNNAAFHPHGERLFLPTHDQKRAFWMDAGASTEVSSTYLDVTLLIAHGITAVTSNLTLYLFELVGSAWQIQTEYTMALPAGPTGSSVTQRVYPLRSAYYALGAKPGEDPAGSAAWFGIAASMYSTAGVMGHSSLPHVNDMQSNLTSLRPISAALLLSPNGAAFQRQGQVRATQLPSGVMWTDAYYGESDYFNTADGVYSGPWEKGFYGYIKPTQDKDFDFYNLFRTRGGVVVDVDCPLFAPGGQIVARAFAAAQSLGGPAAYSAGISVTHVAFAVEFRTLNTWFSQDVPKMSDIEFADTMRLVRDMPQFFENPMHIGDILRWIKGATVASIRVVPRVVSRIAHFLPAVGNAITAGEAGVEIYHALSKRKNRFGPKSGTVAPMVEKFQMVPRAPRKSSLKQTAPRKRSSSRKAAPGRKASGLDLFLASRGQGGKAQKAREPRARRRQR